MVFLGGWLCTTVNMIGPCTFSSERYRLGKDLITKKCSFSATFVWWIVIKHIWRRIRICYPYSRLSFVILVLVDFPFWGMTNSSLGSLCQIFFYAGKNPCIWGKHDLCPLISKRWLICDSLSAVRGSVVFYVIQTSFDNSMKYIKHISNTESCLSSPVKPVLCESVGYECRSSLLCINST